MKSSLVYRVVLCIVGCVALAVAATLIVTPIDFLLSSQLDIGDNIRALSEISAPAGALIACGMIILTGAFSSQGTYRSLLISAIFYFFYGIWKITGLAGGGLPGESLLHAAVLEILVGVVCLVLLLRYGQLSQKP